MSTSYCWVREVLSHSRSVLFTITVSLFVVSGRVCPGVPSSITHVVSHGEIVCVCVCVIPSGSTHQFNQCFGKQKLEAGEKPVEKGREETNQQNAVKTG